MIEHVAVAGDYGTPAAPTWRETDWSTLERDAVIGGATRALPRRRRG